VSTFPFLNTEENIVKVWTTSFLAELSKEIVLK
jgi:hypothetical protein